MSRYTEPPWEIVIPEEHGAKGERFYIIRAADSTVAAVYPTGDVHETKANANLINAAPELLDRLKATRDVLLAVEPKADVTSIDAVIAKALGTPPGRALQSPDPTPPTEAKE